MSSIIFMGGGEFMGFGFSEGGVDESRSPIYIYVRGQGRLWGGEFFPTINFIRSAGVVGSGKVLRGNRATFQKKI